LNIDGCIDFLCPNGLTFGFELASFVSGGTRVDRSPRLVAGQDSNRLATISRAALHAELGEIAARIANRASKWHSARARHAANGSRDLQERGAAPVAALIFRGKQLIREDVDQRPISWPRRLARCRFNA
jgi:hypothetical protein